MPSPEEMMDQQSPYLGPLQDGLKILDLNQSITFHTYTRTVLPIDGYVFWVPSVPITVQGALHYSQEILQNEDETKGEYTVVFTAQTEVTQFSQMPINTIFVARIAERRFSFSQQNGFFQQTALFHYFGHTIDPAMETQLLDDPSLLDPSRAIVSNSLPFWLSLSSYKPIYGDGFTNSTMMYPSFLVPPNQTGKYIAVHIPPERTKAIQAVPYLSPNRSHYQLVQDEVRVTLYGFQSDESIDFLDCVLQYMVDTDNMGLMNMPCIMDGKRVQTELQAIGMQKFIDFQVSYYQFRAQTVARTLIKKAFASYAISSP